MVLLTHMAEHQRVYNPDERPQGVTSIGGRPWRWQTPEELEQDIDAWYNSCRIYDTDTQQYRYTQPVTLTGLAVYLDTIKEVLLKYNERDGFQRAIERAKQYCEHYASSYLFSGKPVAGAIFYLTNLHGWTNSYNTNTNVSIESKALPITDTKLIEQIQEIQDRLEK